MLAQARETPRQFIERESHYLWGRRYLLRIQEHEARPSVSVSHNAILLRIRPNSDYKKRAEIMQAWQRQLLHKAVQPLITKGEKRMQVDVSAYYLQRMKTKWGSCNHRLGNIRLNTELVKKPKDLFEYIIVHEMVHLLEPTHNERFVGLLSHYYPAWREAAQELNALPLSDEAW